MIALMLVAAVSDVCRYIIPNWLSLAIVALYGAAVVILGIPFKLACIHAGVAAVFLLIGLILFARGWVGGGDAKLLAAGAIWVDATQVPSYLTAVALAGGVLAFVLILLRRIAWPDDSLGRFRVLRVDAPAPYGVAIAAGTIWIFADKIRTLATTVDFSPSSLMTLTMS
jgi:prepilin peptidase CpaA